MHNMLIIFIYSAILTTLEVDGKNGLDNELLVTLAGLSGTSFESLTTSKGTLFLITELF